MSEEERTSRGIAKFTSIVALDIFNGVAKLSGYISKEICQSRKCLILEPQREHPGEIRVVVNNNEIIFEPRQLLTGDVHKLQ